MGVLLWPTWATAVVDRVVDTAGEDAPERSPGSLPPVSFFPTPCAGSSHDASGPASGDVGCDVAAVIDGI